MKVQTHSLWNTVSNSKINYKFLFSTGAEGTSYHPLTFKNQLTISHCGGLLVSSLVKGLVVIWNLRNGCEVMKAFEFPNRYVGMSPLFH